MRYFLSTFAAFACSLALVGAVQAYPGPGKGGGGKASAGKASAGKASAGKASAGKASPGKASGSKGSFKSTPRAGQNFSYRSRPSHWGRRTWNASYGCWCYWNQDADCYYYWCEPDGCYYPLSCCPTGRYDYPEPQ